MFFRRFLKKVMKWYLISFMNEHSILNSNQFGFQKGKSTEYALVEFSKRLYNEINKSNDILSIFIYFSKAFDTVPHDLLIRKMEFYGIRGNLSKWFRDYQSDRTQQTNIDSFLSTTDKITLGVLQDGVWGPFLFLLFTNDLPNISKLFYTILFADDATLSLVGPDQSY